MAKSDIYGALAQHGINPQQVEFDDAGFTYTGRGGQEAAMKRAIAAKIAASHAQRGMPADPDADMQEAELRYKQLMQQREQSYRQQQHYANNIGKKLGLR